MPIRFTVSYVDRNWIYMPSGKTMLWRPGRLARWDTHVVPEVEDAAIAFDRDLTEPSMKNALLSFVHTSEMRLLVRELGVPIVVATPKNAGSALFFSGAECWPQLPHAGIAGLRPETNAPARAAVVTDRVWYYEYTDGYSTCFSPLKFMHCVGCDQLKPQVQRFGGDKDQFTSGHCAEQQFRAWASQNGISLDVKETNMDMAIFRKMVSSMHVQSFGYLKPHLAQAGGTKPGCPSVLAHVWYDWPSSEDVESLRKSYSQQAQNGQESRVCAKICRRCTFYEGCRDHRRGWLGRYARTSCQGNEGRHFGHVSHNGPFENDVWVHGLNEWKKLHPDVNWQDVAMFARGIDRRFTTKLVPKSGGLSMYLSRMTPDLDGVVFSNKYGDVTLSIPDAKLILRAERGWGSRNFYDYNEDPYDTNGEMAPLEQALYVEACALRRWERRGHGMFGSGNGAYSIKTVRTGPMCHYRDKIEVRWFSRGHNIDSAETYADWVSRKSDFYRYTSPGILVGLVSEDVIDQSRKKLLEEPDLTVVKPVAKKNKRQQELPLTTGVQNG